MNVRKLNAGDLHRFGRMIQKVAPKVAKVNFQKMEGEEKSAHAERVGKEIFPILLESSYEDLWEWLASMAGKTVEEFDEMDIDAPLEIIEEIIKKEEFGNFFKKASMLLKSQL